MTHFRTPDEASLDAFKLALTVANVNGRAVQKLRKRSNAQRNSLQSRLAGTHRLQLQTPLAIVGALFASFQCCEILFEYGSELEK